VRVNRKKFAGLRSNLRHVLPEASPAQLDKVVRRNAHNWLRGWVDVLEMRRGRERMSRRLLGNIGVEHYMGALERGKGVVLVSMHYGSWEAGLAIWNSIGGEVALLAERLEPKALFDHVMGSRSALGVKVIPLDVPRIKSSANASEARAHGAAAMREVIKHLRGGGVIAIAVDRDLIGNGVPLDFFGRPAPIPVGAVEIAIRAGAVILPVMLERMDGHNIVAVVYPEMVYDPGAPRDAEAKRVSQEVLRICEEAIRVHPEQWHVFEPLWEPQPAP
jgi:KDO2-lipid IV(A) lauroyltransferase